jgi:hypothetical protein
MPDRYHSYGGKMRALRQRIRALGVAAALAGLLVYAAVAFADTVQNDVVATGIPETKIVTVTAGGAGATVNYKVHADSGDSTDTTGRDGQNCNPADGSTATVTPSGMPTGVTAGPTSLTFSSCETEQGILFTAANTTTPGDYPIAVGVTDSEADLTAPGVDYNVNPGAFVLRVQAAGSTLAAPTVSGALTTSPNAAGWFNSRPTVQWTFGGGAYTSLTGDCATASGNPLSQLVPSGDTGTGSVTCTATNATGSSAPATVSYKLDETKPTSSVSGFVADAVYSLGDVLPTAGCTGSDATSLIKTGFDGVVTQTAFLTGNGVGTASFTCNGAEDNADNVQTVAGATRSYTVQYVRDGGILQPINADGNSVFNIKRAVPVKFRLAGDEPNGFDPSNWTLKRENRQCGSESWEAETLADVGTTAATTGLRYDPTADQYIANATLNGATVGKCYVFVVGLDDNTAIESPKFKVGK